MKKTSDNKMSGDRLKRVLAKFRGDRSRFREVNGHSKFRKKFTGEGLLLNRLRRYKIETVICVVAQESAKRERNVSGSWGGEKY